MGSKGLWCQSCAVHIDRPEIADGKLCCFFCGRVVSEDNWSEEVTFAKDAGGQSRAQGTINHLASGHSLSRERTLQRASEDMEWIFLSVCNDDDREVVLEPARRFYTEQLAKEAATAAAKAAYEANLSNCPEGMEDAQKLAADAATAAAKLRKERQQKRAAEARRNSTPQTAAEATCQMLAKKRLNSKINYAVLDELFEESNPKKSRTDNVLHSNKTKLELEDRNEDSKLGSEDEYEDVAAGDFAGGYAGDIDHGNVEEGYDCNDDYGFEEY